MRKIVLLIILSVSFCGMLSAQQRNLRLSGTVTEKTGDPVIGAVMVIKGTDLGTVCDINGRYKLLVAANDVLQVSRIGMSGVEVQVNGRANIDIVLQEEVNDLGIPPPPYGRRSNISLTLGGSFHGGRPGLAADFIIYFGYMLPRKKFEVLINYIDIGIRAAGIADKSPGVSLTPFYQLQPSLIVMDILQGSYRPWHKLLYCIPYVECGYAFSVCQDKGGAKGWNFSVGLRPYSFNIANKITVTPKAGYSMFIKNAGFNFIYAGLEIKLYKPILLY